LANRSSRSSEAPEEIHLFKLHCRASVPEKCLALSTRQTDTYWQLVCQPESLNHIGRANTTFQAELEVRISGEKNGSKCRMQIISAALNATRSQSQAKENQ